MLEHGDAWQTDTDGRPIDMCWLMPELWHDKYIVIDIDENLVKSTRDKSALGNNQFDMLKIHKISVYVGDEEIKVKFNRQRCMSR
jgi:hypothetical protein